MRVAFGALGLSDDPALRNDSIHQKTFSLQTTRLIHPRHSCAALGVTHAKRFQNLIGHLLDIVGLTSNVPDLSCSAAPDASLLAFLLLRNVRVKTNEKLLFAPSPPYKM